MENEANAMTWDEFWTQTVGNIQKDKAITQQMEEAKGQFPELVSAFGLLSAYVGYMHNRLDTARNVLGIDATFLPLSIPLPDGFCERNPLICQAIGGDADAAAILDGGNGHIPDSEGPVVGFDNCTLLKKRYDELKRQEAEWTARVGIHHPAGGGAVLTLDEALHASHALTNLQFQIYQVLEQMKANNCPSP